MSAVAGACRAVGHASGWEGHEQAVDSLLSIEATQAMSTLPPIDSPETFPGWHAPWPAFEVDWKRAALVVIDMQNYGCNPGAGLGPMLAERYPEIARYYFPRVSETVVPNARRLLEGFRAAGARSSSRVTGRSSPTAAT